jgi:hypothetical protein
LCSLSYNLLPWNCLWLVYIRIQYILWSCRRAREFNDPNYGFSELCIKKNTLTKLAKMSRVRHNAKSIESRYNSLNILTKLFETFCHSTKGRHFEKDKLSFIRQLINILFCGHHNDWKSTMCAETYYILAWAPVPQWVKREPEMCAQNYGKW